MKLLSLLVFVVLATCESPEERAKAMLAQMTLSEKLAMVHGHKGPYVGNTPAIERLGIPAIHLQDGPQGVGGGAKGATCFPSVITVTASWDEDAMREFASAMAKEQRLKGSNVHLGPMLNLARVPVGGRNFESMGEDPVLAGFMAAANVRGIQSEGILACAKHFALNNQEFERNLVSAEIDERTQFELYYPGFIHTIEADVGSFMCVYNKINGTYGCENDVLLNGHLKGTFGFKGFVMSDWFATHSTVPAALAGLDQEMPFGMFFGDSLSKAVQAGTVPVSRIDDMVYRILYSLYKVGIMDRPPSGDLSVDVTSPEHNALARKLSRLGTVLLKNSGILPLDPNRRIKVAVLGQAAKSHPVIAGGGSGYVIPSYIVTPLAGLQSRAPQYSFLYSSGDWLWEAKQLARNSDLAIVVVGCTATEGSDRSNLRLGLDQDKLVEAILEVQPNTIVVVNSPGSVILPWAAKAPAILARFLPGQEDGNALADILFGDFNPSGKLPITLPVSEADPPLPTADQYPGINHVQHYSEKLHIGYRWYDAQGVEPLYPFGHGLSYTTFAYSNLRIDPSRRLVAVTITNTGKRAGAEVAQLYVSYPSHLEDQPPKMLRGFVKVELQAGESRTVEFPALTRPYALSTWDVTRHDWVEQRGTFRILVGSSSRDIRLTGSLDL